MALLLLFAIVVVLVSLNGSDVRRSNAPTGCCSDENNSCAMAPAEGAIVTVM